MIHVEQLCFSYGGNPILRDVDFDVRSGEILGILGPNGCGKSTLLRLLRGLLTPTAGRILWKGQPVQQLGRREMARMAAVVPQSLSVPFSYPVREIVGMGRFAHQSGFLGPSSADIQAVERSLAVTDTLHLAGRPVTALSGGELQRVLLARALAQEAPTLFLDEATSNLDLNHRLESAQLLVRLNREQGTTVIHVSHDLNMAAEFSHRILLLSADGTPVALGAPAEVFTPANLRQVFQVEVQVETNPYTGTPRLVPLTRAHPWAGIPPRIHVICGGGSGADILRRLHVEGCMVTAGPINRGDSDEALANALGLETVLEEPFCAFSEATLKSAKQLCQKAEALLIAPTAWGPGNLACLDVVHEAIQEGVPVILINPTPDRDFCAGKAWQTIQGIEKAGGRFVADTEAALDLLKKASVSKDVKR